LKLIAVIDGEHHPGVVRDALVRLEAEHEIVGVLFAGGEEKVADSVLIDARDHYGHEVTVGTDLPELDADAVFDLSGDPVLSPVRRLELAAAALERRMTYLAPGLRVTPPPIDRVEADVPILSVIGTGKRTGKTAVAGHLAALLREGGAEPVIVSMGRGGPPEPQIVRAGERLDGARLLDIARSGRHAASDYLEDAALTGVATVGTRRCGEGPAGEVFDSNVADGVRLALTLDPAAVVLEGSGSAIPPVAADRTVCVTRAEHGAVSGLESLRLNRAQLVIALGDRGTAVPHPNVIRCELVPVPTRPAPEGARAAVFTTATPEGAEQISAALERSGLEVGLVSTALARRAELERDLAQAALAGCDLFLTEIKAAAIEVVAERAERDRVELGFLGSRLAAVPGEPSVDEALWRLYEEARG
jgi:cyclic 2,3-diphosphoglycerate synthetase